MKDAILNVRLDSALKEQTNILLKSKGLTHSQLITMLYRYIANTKEIPFELNYEPNAETLAAMEEAEKIANNSIARRKYGKGKEVINSILEE